MRKLAIKNSRIVVTGGGGFLGKHLVESIKKKAPRSISVPERPEFDLRNFQEALKAFKGKDIVIHLAANVGGIGYNREHPAELFDDNILMGTNCVRAAKQMGVKKFVAIETVCAYPKFTPVPFKEENLWQGYPEETNAPYGMAKKMLIVQTKAYFDQYKFRSINLIPVNLYGPGDNFNPASSHVVPALIQKFVEAKYRMFPEVEVWGTGKATREFLYVEDAARAIILATERLESLDPINLGSGMEISIKKLAQLIKKTVGYTGEIKWNTKMPDGQPRRKLNTRKAFKLFGFKAKVGFKRGIKNTIDWYLPIWKAENGFAV